MSKIPEKIRQVASLNGISTQQVLAFLALLAHFFESGFTKLPAVSGPFIYFWDDRDGESWPLVLGFNADGQNVRSSRYKNKVLPCYVPWRTREYHNFVGSTRVLMFFLIYLFALTSPSDIFRRPNPWSPQIGAPESQSRFPNPSKNCTGWCPLLISWFITPINYSYI